MRIALLGYGKMGKEIEKIALQRKHEIVLKIDIHNQDEFISDNLKKADVAIEFTSPATAFSNFKKCFEANIPVVSGTTGWLEQFQEVKKLCLQKNQTFFYASNYSLGVNLYFKVNKFLAKLMNSYPDYDIAMEEIHHTQKLDAPSGTAITIANDIICELDRKTKWSGIKEDVPEQIYIESIREGVVPGIHKVHYFSDFDDIDLIHSAKSRKGFALGAVLAAEFVFGKKGFLGMDDLLSI